MSDYSSKLATLPAALVDVARTAFDDYLSAVGVHGSAHSGRDFVPYWSDFDCHFYLSTRVLDESDEARIDRALAFRRGYAKLDPGEYGVYYIQTFFLLADLYPADWPAPIVGTYEIVYGTAPPGWSSGNRPDAMDAARATLANLPALVTRITIELPDLHRQAFARSVRSLGTFVKPAIYAAATLITRDVVATWNADRETVLSIVENEVALPSARAFYECVLRWQDVRRDERELEAMTRDGVRTLVALHDWHSSGGS